MNEDEIYNHFNDNIYKPLSLKSIRKSSFSETLFDFLSDKESLVKDVKFETNYGILENFVLNNFQSIVNLPERQQSDKQVVSRKI